MLLILTDFFPPGFRSGGPARSCFNLSVGLGQSLPVRVLTRDRDLGSPLPYPQIPPNRWLAFAAGVEACYLSPQQQGFWSIRRYVRQSPGAVLYLNSMFSLPFTIYPLLAHWLGLLSGRLVLAPRGMLKASALQFKAGKKKVFLALFRALGWHKSIVFQATNDQEAQDIARVFGSAARVVVCPPVPELALLQQRTSRARSAGRTRLCIVGRLHPIKNIHQALALLADLDGAIQVDVIGPAEDEAYAARCQAIAAGLPGCIQVTFHGALPVEATQAIVREADFFYSLTQGENFGHAIFEALALGKPVIISDQTPWRDLSRQSAGWDLPLAEPLAIQRAIQQAVAMPDAVYQQWSDGAHRLASDFVEQSNWKEQYLQLFNLSIPT